MSAESSTTTATLLDLANRHLFQNYARAPLCLVRGEGVRLWDTDGKEYLDFVGGIAVDALGHSHPKIVGAIREQATTLLHVSNLYQIPSQIHLAKLLCDHSFADRAFFCNSGAEANEAAIKLARKYAKETRASDCVDIITMRGAFHGRTMGALSATPNEKYQHGFEPLLPGFKYVPFGDLRAVERAIDNRTAAVLVEPIQGEGGVHVAPEDYLPGIRRLCDESGALLILDEVQTGMARTGRLWAHQHWGIEPDVMTLAKALASGIPIGAMLARESCARVMVAGSHGTTFGGNPFATTVGVATVTTMLEDKLADRADRMGAYLARKLRELASAAAAIKEVRGKGLLIGIELDRPASPVVSACRDRGLLILTAGDTVLRMTPPLIVDEPEVDRAVAILGDALGHVRP
jgi:acetylornithine aminotransferase/acetylornithine/N-succinyldiaminopimelate aminotransferase